MENFAIVYPKPKHDADGKFTESTLKRVDLMELVGGRFFAKQPERRQIPVTPKLSAKLANRRGKYMTV